MRRMRHLAWLALAMPLQAAAECPDSATTADLALALDTAEAHYGALEVDQFKAATDQARQLVPCLTDPVTKPLAARYHRFQGLRGFIDRDQDLSTRSFAAARSIEPGYRFPTSLVPEGNPVLTDYEAVDVDAGKSLNVPKPAGGRLQFDGRDQLKRPMSWPTILQIFDDGGSVVSTHYLRRDADMPEYAAAPVATGPDPKPEDPVELPDKPPEKSGGGGGTRLALGIVAGAAAAGAVGSYFGAKSIYDNYEEQTDLDAIRRQRTTNNVLVITSGTLGAVAVGAGVGIALTW